MLGYDRNCFVQWLTLSHNLGARDMAYDWAEIYQGRASNAIEIDSLRKARPRQA